MNFVFGPVPSRRLGQSLGIDTLPLKTCNWNCVYCQLGRTKPLTNQRKAYYPRQEILAEVRLALGNHKPGAIDWITFVGSGEPTLHSDIGWLIRQVKTITPLPVAVITNGALLYDPDVRQELRAADVVLSTLDAGTPDLYKRLNRPHPDITFKRQIDGLLAFAVQYHGKLWPEVMLVQGLNDTEEALRDIAAILHRINPTEIHINLPTCPPVETWVCPPDEEGLMRAQAILGAIAHVVHPAQGAFDLSGCHDQPDGLADAIISIVRRHPMGEEDLCATLEYWSPGAVKATLAALQAGGQAQVIRRYDHSFWTAAPAHFPEDAQSRAVDPRRPKATKSHNPLERTES